MDDSMLGGDRTHLTWRDLPAAPPLGPDSDPAPAPVWSDNSWPASAPAVTAAAPRRASLRRRGVAVFAVGALIGALLVGGASMVFGGTTAPVQPSGFGRTPRTSPPAALNGGGAAPTAPA